MFAARLKHTKVGQESKLKFAFNSLHTLHCYFHSDTVKIYEILKNLDRSPLLYHPRANSPLCPHQLYTALTFNQFQSFFLLLFIKQLLYIFQQLLYIFQHFLFYICSFSWCSHWRSHWCSPWCPNYLLSCLDQVLTAWGRRLWGLTGAGRSLRGYMSSSGLGRGEMVTRKRRRRLGGWREREGLGTNIFLVLIFALCSLFLAHV